jgi:signal transduction histidine kinase/CheY-like chemotaxis protein
MAEEAIDRSEEGAPFKGRALWISASALAATIALIGLIFMITWSNRARDDAIGWERRTYEVMVLTRTIGASVARSEAALGRYVLDEQARTGADYSSEWRRANWQISQLERMLRIDPAQRRRVAELRALLDRRNGELGPAAAAARRRQGTDGLSLLYQASSSPTLPALRAKLDEIANAERARLNARMAETQIFVTRADAYTDWLGWVAILVGLGAIGLAFLAWRSYQEGVLARREAEAQGWRALDLEQAVEERTSELSEANARLKQEVTERIAAEAQLRQVQKMEAVGQLTGGIAHDFNNMLAVVVGGIDLARRKLHGSRREVEFHLDSAMEGATRAAALTRRLLAFARSEPLLPEAVAPSERIEGMLELIDRAIGERIQVRTQFADETWHVWVDPAQLENAILNLAVNARDAMEGSGELLIEVGNVALGEREIEDLPRGDYVRIAVTDTGAGIAPELLDRVFEPFFTTKPVGKGTGLGLSQIFGFARQSGGHATISSEVGRGTCVALYVPRSIGAAARAADRLAVPAPTVDPIARHRGAIPLVVEDDPRVSRSTVAALEELGYRPIACSSGAEALEVLATNTEVELVITDVMMPEMTGTELAAAIRQRGLEVPILFVTGYVGEAGDAEDLAGGELLRKPFTVSALAAAVETTLSRAISGSPLASKDEAAE